jgi:hypothetical protein
VTPDTRPGAFYRRIPRLGRSSASPRDLFADPSISHPGGCWGAGVVWRSWPKGRRDRHGRFVRAIKNGNLVHAETAAREMGGLTLEDALALTTLMASAAPHGYERAALRWLGPPPVDHPARPTLESELVDKTNHLVIVALAFDVVGAVLLAEGGSYSAGRRSSISSRSSCPRRRFPAVTPLVASFFAHVSASSSTLGSSSGCFSRYST